MCELVCLCYPEDAAHPSHGINGLLGTCFVLLWAANSIVQLALVISLLLKIPFRFNIPLSLIIHCILGLKVLFSLRTRMKI